jgi:GGDEF domain-containing protein
VRNAARQGDRLALLFLDSDHFKQINDTSAMPWVTRC